MGSRTSGAPDSGAVQSTRGSQPGQELRARRFGVFELDLRAGELRRNGLKVKLQEQPFQVLALLVEKPGEIVTRDDLRQRLWPADTFVDFDHSLNAAIKRLRDALGDSAENPTFVETVARRGYRFLAPVSVTLANGNSPPMVQSAAPESAVADSILKPPRYFHRRWIPAAIGAVALLLLGIKLGLSFARHHPDEQFRISRLTANPADDHVRCAAISRDGKLLAFSDETGFYLRQIETGETHSIALPAGLMASSLSWFPDSSHIVAALAGPDQSSSIWEISTLGGSPRKLSDEGKAPAVSPDGKAIAFIAGKKTREQVWVMAADGAQPRKLVGGEGDSFGALAWSPDSIRIAYTRGVAYSRVAYSFGVNGALELVDVRDLHTSRLVEVAQRGWFSAVDGPLAWAGDGHLIYSLAEPPPRQLDSNLWSVSLDGSGQPTGPPVRITSDPGAVSNVSISGDGKRVVYVKGVPQPDVYVAKVEGPGISDPVRLTLDDRQDLPFDWTPDGKFVLFISDRTGTFKVYRQATDQTVAELLVGGDRPILGARLSPDGTQLLYLVYPNRSDNLLSVPLMRMPLAGGAPQKVTEANWIANEQCARAPATVCLYSVEVGSQLTFFSFDPFKGSGVQVYQIKDETPQLYNWSLSPDGTRLAIAKGKWGDEEPRIHLVSLGTGSEEWLEISNWPGVASVDWAADSKSLWVATSGEEENALLNIDLQGHARPVWQPKKMGVYWAIPSRDGKYLALHVGSTSANAWMLELP